MSDVKVHKVDLPINEMKSAIVVNLAEIHVIKVILEDFQKYMANNPEEEDNTELGKIFNESLASVIAKTTRAESAYKPENVQNLDVLIKIKDKEWPNDSSFH